MMLIVLLYFLGCFVTAATGTNVQVDCGITKDEGCGAMDHACKAKFHSSLDPTYFRYEIAVMFYEQDANASEPSCSDSECEYYESGPTYYVVDDFSASEDFFVTSGPGRDALCEETCSMDLNGDPTGFCQLQGQCTNSTGMCIPIHPGGTATFTKISKDILFDCGLDDEENCGTAKNPCNAKFHASSGFSQNDVVSMFYKQLEADGPCENGKCIEYISPSLVYYTVVDTTSAAEGQVIMGPKGFAAACTFPCAENAGDPFSGYCQKALLHCPLGVAGQCAGSSAPVGKAYFQWESTTTTTTTTTASPTGTATPPTGTTTPPTGTATGTTEPTTASAMTAAFGLAPAAFAVVAVLALWA